MKKNPGRIRTHAYLNHEECIAVATALFPQLIIAMIKPFPSREHISSVLCRLKTGMTVYCFEFRSAEQLAELSTR
jgi:hypothetical protein